MKPMIERMRRIAALCQEVSEMSKERDAKKLATLEKIREVLNGRVGKN